MNVWEPVIGRVRRPVKKKVLWMAIVLTTDYTEYTDCKRKS